MSIRFAGSRSLDERRRRRLASENEELPLQNTIPVGAVALLGPSRAEREARRGLSKGVPFRKFISPKLWKHWAIAVAGTMLASLVLFLGFHEEAIARVGGPNLGELISLSTGRLATCFNSMTLLLAGQVSIVIFWARARSQEDFGGRFRIWAWTFTAWFAAAAVVATGAHNTFSETMLWLSNAHFWQQQTLCWFLPALVLGSVLWVGLCRDMAGCRSSHTMLMLAAVLFLAFSLVKLDLTGEFTNRWSETLQVGGAMLGCLALFLSMLLHARHVIYVTSEPPEIHTGRLRKLVSLIRIPKIRIRRDRVEDAARMIDEESVDSASGSDELLREAPNEPSESEQQRVRVDEHGEDSRLQSVAKPNLKGLSKRQRREALKEWREELRLQS